MPPETDSAGKPKQPTAKTFFEVIALVLTERMGYDLIATLPNGYQDFEHADEPYNLICLPVSGYYDMNEVLRTLIEQGLDVQEFTNALIAEKNWQEYLASL